MRLNAVWVGGSLTYIEQACLSSALAVGHPVDLWTYSQIEGVPDGVRVRDAREVMPERLMVRHHRKSKSPAIGADIFRLLLQQQGRGCYIDCDMLLLKPISDEEHIFGWERSDRINNAVLRLPAESPVLADMLAMIRSRLIVAPWWGWRRKLRAIGQAAIGKVGPQYAPWGTTGPLGVTYFAKRHGISHLAKAQTVFYPVPSFEAATIFSPSAIVDTHCTADTIAIHLCHSGIKGRIGDAPPPGSWIDTQCRRLGVTASMQRAA